MYEKILKIAVQKNARSVEDKMKQLQIQQVEDVEMLDPKDVEEEEKREEEEKLTTLLQKSLAPKAPKKSVKLVFSLRHLIPQADSDLLLKAALTPVYLSTEEGRKLIEMSLIAHPFLLDEVMKCVRKKLCTFTASQAEAYGKIFFRTWAHTVKHNMPEFKIELELSCIQTFIKVAMEGKNRQTVNNARTILTQFHIQKKEVYVMKMLYFLYQPNLWRYLKSEDGVVRANAAHMLLAVFPLEDPDARITTIDQEMITQMLTVRELLMDPYPIVRIATIDGLAIAMNVHWEIFHEEMLKTYFRILVNELSCDSSSSDVRLAVVRCLIILLENPLTHATLDEVLPKTSHLFYDVAEVVRSAYIQLLMSVKKIHIIKYYKIVPLEHILAQLEIDAVMAKGLVTLLHNSYFPSADDPGAWLGRCIELIKKDPNASKVFFEYVSMHLELPDIVQFMRRAVESLHFYVASKEGGRKEGVKVVGRGGRPAPEDQLGFNRPTVVAGMLDAVSILWMANMSALEKPENKQYLKLIVGKFAKCLGDLSIYYKDSEGMWESVFYLCSFMPASSVACLAPLCFERLQALPPDAPPNLTLLECLCRQQGGALLELLLEWMQEEMEQKEERGGLALRLIMCALERRSCQKALLVTAPEQLKDFLQLMQIIKDGEAGDLTMDLFKMLLQVAVLLQGENQFDAVSYVQDTADWLQQKVAPPSPPVVQEMVKILVDVMTDMTLLRMINYKSPSNFLKFAMTVVGQENFILVQSCRLLLRHATLGQIKPRITGEVPECFNILLSLLCDTIYVEPLSNAVLKESYTLLGAAIMQMEGQVLAAVTRKLIATMLLAYKSAKDDASACRTKVAVLTIICTKEKLMAHFIRQMRFYLKKNQNEWNEGITVMSAIQEYKKKRGALVRNQLMKLVEAAQADSYGDQCSQLSTSLILETSQGC